MAVPEVGARIGREIVIGETSAYVDGHRGIGHTIIERGSVGIAVEVDGVLLEQIGPHDHADVGEGQKHLVVLVKCNQGRWDVAVHDSDVHDLARIDVPVQAGSGASSAGDRVEVGHQPNCTVIGK